ncbi:MAG: 30S ribosomal protein S6 [Deferribacteres bacterium]|nr:30S ribosomal protein S6 [Deferribacteres bacterium]
MDLRCYESVVVFVPELDEKELEEQIQWVKSIIEKNGGEIVKVDNWGKRKLAYEIEKRKEGYYVLFLFRSSGDLVEELERNYRINNNVIRYLTVKRKESECEEKGEE